jgi:antitoxin component of MazEF toxin-antitoxin module
MNNPAQGHIRYEVITQEESDDMIIPLPIPLLTKLGWKNGDKVEIDIDDQGQLFLKKSYK